MIHPLSVLTSKRGRKPTEKTETRRGKIAPNRAGQSTLSACERSAAKIKICRGFIQVDVLWYVAWPKRAMSCYELL